MRPLIALVLAAGLAGCGGSVSPGGDDTHVSDAPAASDAASPQHGLLVSWMAMPALPGPVGGGGNETTVTNAVFHIQHLQVIGDNGQPMTNTAFDITWSTPGADPETVSFVAAPSGLYSQINLEIDASVIANSYVISGTTKLMGNTKPFRIEDRGSLDIDIKNYAVTLAPGTDAGMIVRLDLKDSIESIDWNMVNNQAGTLVLDDTSPQMLEFRDKLGDAFKKGP